MSGTTADSPGRPNNWLTFFLSRFCVRALGADPLVSAFHLSFNMILNLYRTGSGDPEALMKSSYRQHQTELALPSLKQRAQRLRGARESIHISDLDQVTRGFEALRKTAQLKASRRKLLQDPKTLLKFLQPVRLVRVLCNDGLDLEKFFSSRENLLTMAPSVAREEEDQVEEEAEALVDRMTEAADEEGAWGCIVACKRNGARGYQADILVNLNSSDPTNPEGSMPKVRKFDLSRLDAISSVRIYLPKEGLKPPSARKKVLGAVSEVEKRFASNLPLLDPRKDLGLAEGVLEELESAKRSIRDLQSIQGGSGWEAAREGLVLLCKKKILEVSCLAAEREEKRSRELVGHEDLKARGKLLRKLNYVDALGNVAQKGHLAAEISSADELVLTELLVNGVFKELPCPETVSLLSCFVSSGDSNNSGHLREDHDKLFKQLREQVSRVGHLSNEVSMGGVDVNKYLESFSPQLMEATGAWARGSNFAACLKLGGGAFEGSLVRAIRRIEELLQQLIKACQVVGDHTQAEHFDQCSAHIKRDVVFAASLYL